mmetsp:Transcript_14512/g.37619  ORF Transcript_14512/g.37619 Transcript_14512/m.37619 type:complete len:202 (-) Transcript_14512:1121-1726(-)
MPASRPSSVRMGRLRLTRLGMRFSTASTARAAPSPPSSWRAAARCSNARHASSSMTASSLASGWSLRRHWYARSYTPRAAASRAATSPSSSSTSAASAASPSSASSDSRLASILAKLIHTLTCLVRSSRRSYSSRVPSRLPSAISKSMYAFQMSSGMSSTDCAMASSKMERARSVSPRDVSSSANLLHAVHEAGFHSRYLV